MHVVTWWTVNRRTQLEDHYVWSLGLHVGWFLPYASRTRALLGSARDSHLGGEFLKRSFLEHCYFYPTPFALCRAESPPCVIEDALPRTGKRFISSWVPYPLGEAGGSGQPHAGCWVHMSRLQEATMAPELGAGLGIFVFNASPSEMPKSGPV